MEAFILAGGESKRFGSDKALYRIGNEPLVAALHRRLLPLFERVRIVARSPGQFEDLGFDVVVDIRTEQCPLVGIYSGLKHLGRGKAFFAACDLPLVDPKLVRYIMEESEGYDVAVPLTEKGLEPLCAVYDASCVEVMESALASRNLKINTCFESLNTRVIGLEELRRFDPRMLTFWNVNTPDDMALVVETIARERTQRCS